MSENLADVASAAGTLVTSNRSRYFQIMSVTLLAILLTGFAPTLYLRAAFDNPAIPLYLYVHGAIVTCWFILLVVQTSLIAVRRTDIHRRIGVAGAVLACSVVIAGPMATMGFVGRIPSMGFDVEEAIFFVSWVVWGNFASILAFSVFVVAAIFLRRQSDIHKRLILLASLSIIGPPLARIANWSVFNWIDEISFVVVGSLLLFATLVIHDLVLKGRPNTMTTAGGVYFVLTILAPLFIAGLEFAQSFVRGMA